MTAILKGKKKETIRILPNQNHHRGENVTMTTAEDMIFCLVHEIVDDVFANGEEEVSASPAESAICHERKNGEDDAEVSVTADSTPEIDLADIVAGPSASKRPRRRLGVSSGAHDQIVLLRCVR